MITLMSDEMCERVLKQLPRPMERASGDGLIVATTSEFWAEVRKQVERLAELDPASSSALEAT